MMMGKADLASAVLSDGGRQDYGSPTPHVMASSAVHTPDGGHPPTGLSSAVSIPSPEMVQFIYHFLSGRAWLKAE